MCISFKEILYNFILRTLVVGSSIGLCDGLTPNRHQTITLITTHSVSIRPVGTYFNDIHYNDVIMGAIASQITSLTIVYSSVYSGADQRKYQSSASLAFVWGIHQGPVNSPHKWPVTRKMFPFDDVVMLVKIKKLILLRPRSNYISAKADIT